MLRTLAEWQEHVGEADPIDILKDWEEREKELMDACVEAEKHLVSMLFHHPFLVSDDLLAQLASVIGEKNANSKTST